MKVLSAIAVSLAVAGSAAGQIDPKGFLAGKTVDFSLARSLPFISSDTTLFENVLIDGGHCAMVASWKKNKIEPTALYLLPTVQIPFGTITIDGNDPDWAGISPAVADPSSDEDPAYATQPGTDLANVNLARDGDYIYFRMTFHDGGPSENTMYIVEFQQYLTQLHTPGDLYVIAVRWTGQPWTVGVHERRAGGDPTRANVGIAAAGSGFVEWRVPIWALQFQPDVPHPYFPPAPLGPQGIENRYLRSYIHPVPVPGELSPVSDSNESLTRPLVVNFY